MDNKAFVKRLGIIRTINLNNSLYVNKDLYRIVISKPSLVAGYEMIKSNKGATTPATGKESLDGFGKERLERLFSSLADESWQPRPARRVMIPKPGKTSLRPLSIQGPEEKIVQAALLLVLQAVYEPIFSDHSYGFRPNRGAHNALQDLEKKYDGLSFAIEGDIRGMYDYVNQHTLMKLISLKVDDSRLISLLWKFLRAGYMQANTNTFHATKLGTPQGSIVSPLLANIYLHTLDIFIQQLMTQNVETSKKIRTPIAKQYRRDIQALSRNIFKMDDGPEREATKKKLKALKYKNILCRTYCDRHNRIYYHRYADDFIIGIAGSLEFANDIKEKVRLKLEELDLELNLQKTKITNLKKDKARFLGYDISISTAKKITKIHAKGKTPFLKGTTGGLVCVEAPIRDIITKLSLKSFCTMDGYPTPKKIWTIMPDYQIVDSYNATFAGILQYYSGASHRHRLSRLKYIFKFSCAMTLAAKHRSSINKVFKKHGSSLTVTYGGNGDKTLRFKDFNVFKERDKKWIPGMQLSNPYKLIAYRTTKTKLFSLCCICGESNNVEMHHIRHVRKIKTNTFDSLLGLSNRKQIPVCDICHDKIHSGKYDGLKLSDLAYPELARL